eukprot:CAMPEP_0117050908 /NCGR_PEP_ID=MMETSP0472-20121206/35154_1 /TAXON_ID=693140 ORGANISM="Tiarina fusus, Strain LIS" /NCGR_SAMPLE_ID=MMETSP0472 /ASSEMBLY_ACC=CAM_ASM_000603 /LENGTH=118 /DNA_ID=CAMNT_0004764879 /DNA_START=118 /DNA_END=470 /DNA_ORIENTATION=+
MSLLKYQNAISLLFFLVVVSAFQVPRLGLVVKQRCVPLGSNLSGPEDFDDGIGDINGGLDDSKKEGQDLAKEFFRQQRQREQANKEDASPSSMGSISSSTSQPESNNDAAPIPIDRSR